MTAGCSCGAVYATTSRGRPAGFIPSTRSDEKLDNTVRFGGARKRPPVDLPLGQFLPGWTYPDAIHVADMLKALPERRTDPEIVAWLGRPDLVASISSYQKAIG